MFECFKRLMLTEFLVFFVPDTPGPVACAVDCWSSSSTAACLPSWSRFERLVVPIMARALSPVGYQLFSVGLRGMYVQQIGIVYYVLEGIYKSYNIYNR